MCVATFAKREKVLVHTFQIGDSVAIKIPQIDRHKTDTKRTPAIIVKVKGSTPPMYKLACKYGTLWGYYSTLLKWFESYLCNRPQCVKAGESLSGFLHVLCGVPQGSVLGPILFFVVTKMGNHQTSGEPAANHQYF